MSYVILGIAIFLVRKIYVFYRNIKNQQRYYQLQYENILKTFEQKRLAGIKTCRDDFDPFSAYESLEVMCARDILGIEGPYNQEIVEEKFRLLSKIHHPDKKGDPEIFKALVDAKRTLLE